MKQQMQVLVALPPVKDHFLQPGQRGPLASGLHEVVKAVYGNPAFQHATTPNTDSKSFPQLLLEVLQNGSATLSQV